MSRTGKTPLYNHVSYEQNQGKICPQSGKSPKFFAVSVIKIYYRADSRLAPSQWETSLQSNAVSHWLGTNLESTLYYTYGLGFDLIPVEQYYLPHWWLRYTFSWLILGLRPANERCHYKVTPSLTGWAQTSSRINPDSDYNRHSRLRRKSFMPTDDFYRPISQMS